MPLKGKLRAAGMSCLWLFWVLGNLALAYEMPGNLKEGWDGKVQLGALATFGATDASAISARTDFTFKGRHFEQELNAKLYRSASESLVVRRNDAGEVINDEAGVPIKDVVNSVTNDRRFVSLQPIFFFTTKHYLFALVDVEFNEPADIESSSRQVGGAGYKLWRNRDDFVSTAVGIGRKKLVQVSGESTEGAIGYVRFRFKRGLSDNVVLTFDLDSDFGGDNRFSELEASLSWKVRGPVAVMFKYEARVNSNIVNPWNTFDEGVEAALSVNLELEVL